MTDRLQEFIPRIEELAGRMGLEYYPVDFEVVPPSFMMEVAVYGLPVRMPHWSFGVRWIHQMVQHRMGHSKIFEVVFPGNPNRAYLVNSNSLEENTLVVAHVLGHADFSRNNLGFQQSHRQVGAHIVEQAAAHAHRIDEVIEREGTKRVEQVLDAALALEQHIDTSQPIERDNYRPPADKQAAPAEGFQARFEQLPGEGAEGLPEKRRRPSAPIPPNPERDLLWFIARYAPHLEDWERDIFLAVREESFYFQPVFNCQIMNEGWASYWHSRLLREAEFLPSAMYVDCMKTHSDVVRPYGGDKQIALQLNPYHLGYSLWEHLVEHEGMESARKIMAEEDDFGFVRNYLDPEMARHLNLFVWSAKKNGEIKVTSSNLHELHEAILAPKFNFGAPRVTVDELKSDGTLILRHDHQGDGRGLEADRARHVLDYVARVWRAPVRLYTADSRGQEVCLHPRGDEMELLDE